MEEKEWFLYVVDHHEGPFTAAEIKKIVKTGDAKTSSYVWKEGYADWVMMSDVTDFGQGDSKSDGHGPFSFLFGKGKAKAKPAAKSGMKAATKAVPGTAEPAQAVSSGPDLSGVPASASVWCLNSKKMFSGPHSMKHIIRKINDGDISVNDSVWKEGWTSFMQISGIPEFMQSVKPDVLSGGKKAMKKAKGEASASASAMGLGSGGASVVAYHWYKSSRFKGFMSVFSVFAIYQSLASGYLDGPLESAKLKEKVKAMDLKPIPLERLADVAFAVKDAAMPILNKVATILPEPMQGWFSPIHLPDGMSPTDADLLRNAATTDFKSAPLVATALPVGDEFNPSFVIASNAPESTGFMVQLIGKEGTLLNAFDYEKTVFVDIVKHMGVTSKFTFDGGKSLPKGEYTLVVYEADKQPPEVTAALSTIPKKPKTPANVPPTKVLFTVGSYFLGGKKDATYTARLAEFKERSKARLTQETSDLKQIALTLESMANESAQKFFALAATAATPQRKAIWAQYSAKYSKLSAQLKATAAKVTPENRKDFLLVNLYQKTLKTYELTESLHQAQTVSIEKGGSMDAVKTQATQAADAINDLKTSIFKVIK